MFAPYYLCPIMWSYAPPPRYPVQAVQKVNEISEEEIIYLAWYYMVNYVY